MKDEVFMTLAWSLAKLHTDSWYDKWRHKIAYINSVRSQKGVLCSTGNMNNKRADRQTDSSNTETCLATSHYLFALNPVVQQTNYTLTMKHNFLFTSFSITSIKTGRGTVQKKQPQMTTNYI